MVKNDRRILFTSVIPLLVAGGWIVERKEMANQVLIGAFSFVESHVEHFHIAGILHRSSLAQFLVSWILRGVWLEAHKTDCVTKQSAWELILEVLDEIFLSAPIAAGAKGGEFFVF